MAAGPADADPGRRPSTRSSANRSRKRGSATTCSTTRRSPMPTSTGGCAAWRSWRSSSPSCARPIRRPRRSAAQCRRSSPRSTTCSGWRAWTTPSPSRSSRPGGRDWPATAWRIRRCCASSRSTGWRSTSSTSAAGWCGRSPAATDARGRTSRPTSRRSTRSRTASRAPTSSRCPTWSRSAARCSCPPRRSRSSTSRWPRPASRCSPTPATRRPGRCARRTRGSRRRVTLGMVCHGLGARRGFEPATQSSAYAAMRAWGLPTSDRVRVLPDLDAVQGVHRATTASTATTSSTRSTAWWSRSTTSRCSDDWARRRGRRDGRSRSSTHRRRSTPSCSASRSTPGAPAGSRRSA